MSFGAQLMEAGRPVGDFSGVDVVSVLSSFDNRGGAWEPSPELVLGTGNPARHVRTPPPTPPPPTHTLPHTQPLPPPSARPAAATCPLSLPLQATAPASASACRVGRPEARGCLRVLTCASRVRARASCAARRPPHAAFLYDDEDNDDMDAVQEAARVEHMRSGLLARPGVPLGAGPGGASRLSPLPAGSPWSAPASAVDVGLAAVVLPTSVTVRAPGCGWGVGWMTLSPLMLPLGHWRRAPLPPLICR